jgi:succinate dehydrogenase / fumarate reductase flavoprotein subunit
VKIDDAQVDAAAKFALAPFERSSGENAFLIQKDLQEAMQELVGIVRVEAEMQQALAKIEQLWARARKVGCDGNRDYNPGWHTALDLTNLLTVAEAATLCAIDRKESRGGHFRDDYPDKSDAFAKHNTFIRRGPGGEMVLSREPIGEMRDDLKQIIEEQKK